MPREEETLFLDEAVRLGERLLAQRVFARDGSFTWSGPTGYGTDLHPLRIVKLDYTLGSGTAGAAFFLAALARIVGDSYGDHALQALAPLRRKLSQVVSDPDRARALRLQIGALTGIGSLIYALVRIACWLNRPELLDEAHDLTVLLTPERIATDECVRIQTGSAGAILALLVLHERRPEPNCMGRTPLAIACDCAAHLLSQRMVYQGRPRAWRLSPGKPPLAGFSYGAAGISYALARLYEAYPVEEILKAADEGFSFVAGFYSPANQSWRDVRGDFQPQFPAPRVGIWRDWWASEDPAILNQLFDSPLTVTAAPAEPGNPGRYSSAWCHGSAGIALGRLAALHLIDNPDSREAVRASIDALRRRAEAPALSPQFPDDLCCGHSGHVEVLAEAGRRLGNPGLVGAAKSLALRVVHRARETGRYELSAARGKDVYAPSLLQGEAGVGFTLLRLVRPEALSCLVLFD